jgi:RNA-directed DNA polymerase
VDGCTVEEFEKDLKGNLYRIWNRMSSGSYLPPAVLAVEIPKTDGRTRVLGVPTVADRIAQTVVAVRLQERVEPMFHPDSYGYRPNRSALDAVERCRRRCHRFDWVVDLDIQAFFDSVPRDLIVKAVEANTDQSWIVLYVKRWLAAELQRNDGTVIARDRGTPQGSAVSPVLANLFLHYAFDTWMVRDFPTIGFERYVDDVVVHCRSRAQALMLVRAIGRRLEEVGLRLHPDKTRIVYCRDGWRQEKVEEGTSFDFLGYTFRPRGCRNREGNIFTGFAPAISDAARKRVGEVMRSWRLHRKVSLSWQDLARWLNPIVRGWMNYYGRFYRSWMHPLLMRINYYLVRWMRKKYKRLRTLKAARAAWRRITRQYPGMFAHWRWVSEF